MTRRSKQAFFKNDPEGLPPLIVATERTVRFEEVDQLGVVWHGRYVSYLEDGREAFGERFGLKYSDMPNNGFLAPIVQMHIEYHYPLLYKETFTIITALHWSRAARLNFSYQLRNKQQNIVATGYTVQIFMDFDKQPLIIQPAYMDEFYARWKSLLALQEGAVNALEEPVQPIVQKTTQDYNENIFNKRNQV
jgi:acyl-CoA thioester hydrolase